MPVVMVVLLLAAASPKEPCEELRKNGRYSAFFERVELDKLVQTVSDATCKTFIVGENVRGKISMVGPENGHTTLDADQFYAAFLAALDVNGLTVIPSGRFMRITEKPRAKGAAIPVVIDETDKFPARDEMVTRVFKAKNVELEPLRGLLSQFVSSGAEVIAFPPDTLIVNELGSNLARLERIAAAVDVEREPGETLRIVPLRFAEAGTVGDELSRVLTPKAPKPGESLSVTADERSNRLVVVATAAL
ncbi:MAG: type II secretion system protein GspD, partial [Myxococcaceae bacterium]|nr:type II secretion system protein GspD [Myxococcaceae bacterium]